MNRLKVFISGVQKELAEERQAVRSFILDDPLLGRYFSVFLFEDSPACNSSSEELFLEEIDSSVIYIGIFGNSYGSTDDSGYSPTEKEYRRASELGKYRTVFVKGNDDATRDPRMQNLIYLSERDLVRRRFFSIPELITQVYSSLITFLTDQKYIRTKPFDASAYPNTSLDDISIEKIEWFLKVARSERGFALPENTSPVDTLTHLNLMGGGQPSAGALLLFGKNPQRFILPSEVKCLHFHGKVVEKPIPSYQIFKGTLFDLIDQAVDFVLAKVDRRVIPSENQVAGEVEYEIPLKVIREAIVNAVAHRNYVSNASVQVMIFSDRVEIWNPGSLPLDMTIQKLAEPHASIPANPLLCESLFLARYIEKAGTGTLDMIRLCRENKIPEPVFRQDGGQFVVTLRRERNFREELIQLGLSERQIQFFAYLKREERGTNADYQAVTGVTKSTASRDLNAMVQSGVIVKKGTTGKGTYYQVADLYE